MAFVPSEIAGRCTFPHGIHPPAHKEYSQHAPIEVLPSPEEVLIPLLQHLGAPCEPIVSPKQEVVMGQMVGKGPGFVTAPVHASVSGTVKKTVSVTLPNGRHVKAIPIKAGGDTLSGGGLFEEVYGGNWAADQLKGYSPEQIATAIAEAGIVGHGGAAFPTHVKLTANDKKPIDTLMVNGCECEPFLTTDHRLMLEAPGAIATGAALAARAVGAERVMVGIEDNKPDAIEALRSATSGMNIDVISVKTKYPQGSEKQLIKAVLKREVPLGGLPLDVGVVIVNVATATAIARAVLRNKPLTHRVISVTGGGIARPKNILAPIGVRLGELIDFCGGLTPEAARMVAGGPMMGFSFTDLDIPVTKGTSGVTVLTREDIKRSGETHCIRCGRCVEACPMNLVPTKLALACRAQVLDLAVAYHLLACFECGSCAYSCPAKIPLVQLIRTGKAQLAKQKK
jgi:electron transport complex protein RnfC